MISKRQWHIPDKWKRHLGLVGDRRVRRHIPATRLLNRSNLNLFLRRYSDVFIKPVTGSFGNHILRIRKLRRGYTVQGENRVRRVSSEGIVRAVYRHTGRRRFMLQKGVSILKVKGRPVDFRVLLLRPRQKWLYMGTMGKMASAGRVVTNYNHGGKAVRVKEVLREAGYGNSDIRRMENAMVQISRTAAVAFNRKHKHCRRLGIDIAIDRAGRAWILEVNTNPFYQLFRKHQDKRLYGMIHSTMRTIRSKQSDR